MYSEFNSVSFVFSGVFLHIFCGGTLPETYWGFVGELCPKIFAPFVQFFSGKNQKKNKFNFYRISKIFLKMTTFDYTTQQSKKRSLPQSTESSKKQKTQLTFPEFQIQIPALYNPFINLPDGPKGIFFQSIDQYGSFWGSPDTNLLELSYKELEVEQECREVARIELQIALKETKFFRENGYPERDRLFTEKVNRLKLHLIRLDSRSQNIAKKIMTTNLYKEKCFEFLKITFLKKFSDKIIEMISDYVTGYTKPQPRTQSQTSDSRYAISDLPFAITDDDEEDDAQRAFTYPLSPALLNPFYEHDRPASPCGCDDCTFDNCLCYCHE